MIVVIGGRPDADRPARHNSLELRNDIRLSHAQEILAFVADLGTGILAIKDNVPNLYDRLLTVFINFADRNYFSSLRLFFRGIGDDDTT